MEIIYIQTPLGIAKIAGDGAGIAVISILSEGEISKKIPKELQECVSQLREYFDGNRNDFTFKLNPQGTDFQQRVWVELLNIPFGKNSKMQLSYFEKL